MKTPRLHPNHTTKSWVRPYWLAGINVTTHKPKSGYRGDYSYHTCLPRAVEDLLVGVAWLGATSSLGQPKVKPNTILAILASQDVISTKTVAECLGGDYSPRTIDNYCIAARVASKAIYKYMMTHPKEVQRDLDAWKGAEGEMSTSWTQEQIDAWIERRDIYQEALAKGGNWEGVS